MPCGCQSACGCNVTAGAGISVQRLGDTFEISSTNALITLVAGDGIDIVQDELEFTISSTVELPDAPIEFIRGYWDFAVDGGAVGEIPLRDVNDDPLVIEENAIVFGTTVHPIEQFLPDGADPFPAFGIIKFDGGTAQLATLFGGGSFGGEAQVPGTAHARSFTPGGTPVILDIYPDSAFTAGSFEAVFLVIPAP